MEMRIPGTLLLVLSLLATPTISFLNWRSLLMEWPAPWTMPAWISIPWGPAPDWEALRKSTECRNEMKRTLSQIREPCGNDPPKAPHAACKIRVAIVQMRAAEYTRKDSRYTFQAPATSLVDKYCQRWGFCTHTVLTNPTFDRDKFPDVYERHPAWRKVLAVHQAISNASATYDWVMWMDGDAAIIDHSIDLRFVIAASPPSANMLISEDAWQTVGEGSSNTGVFLARVNDFSRNLMEAWYRAAEQPDLAKHKKDHPWEQGVFNKGMWGRYETIHRFPFCWLFGHPWSLLDQPFIAHMPGLTNENKLTERLRYFSFWDAQTIAGQQYLD